MNVCQAVLFDGEKFYYGSSSAFMLPKELSKILHQQGLDLSQALNQCAYVEDDEVGRKGGAIGVFTEGRLLRAQYAVQALHNLFSLYIFEERHEKRRENH